MTSEATTKNIDHSQSEYKKLSIQVSLSGLSFCILDTLSHTVIASERTRFKTELAPHAVLKEIKALFDKHGIRDTAFAEVIIIHRNNLFSLVPLALFNKDELANYLKFNAKILANDHLAYDEVDNLEMVNVYVPFVNINNYLFDLFGDFDFMHHGTVLIQNLMNGHGNHSEPICYIHISEEQMDIVVLNGKKLTLYNNFKFSTKEDFIYYLLFTLEQLKLSPETTKLKLFGAIEEGDTLYQMCHKYIKDLAIFVPARGTFDHLPETDNGTIDFTLLNTL